MMVLLPLVFSITLLPQGKKGCLEQRAEFLIECCLRGGTDKLVNELTVLEEQDGGDVAHAKLNGKILFLVNIAFSYHDAAIVVICQLGDDGAYHAAGSTPRSPQVDNHRQGAILQALKILTCDCYFHIAIVFMIK